MTERTTLQEALDALRPFKDIADTYRLAQLATAEAYRDEGRKEPAPLPDTHTVSVALGQCRRAAAAFDSLSNHLKGEGDGNRD